MECRPCFFSSKGRKAKDGLGEGEGGKGEEV